MRRHKLAFIVLSVLQSSAIGAVESAYTIQRVGLSTPEFFNANGQQYSFGPNRAGRSLQGGSDQYFGSSQRVGEVPYLHDLATGVSSAIGLMDPAHTGPEGQLYGWAGGRNDLGYVVGNSVRFAAPGPGVGEFGTSAWFFDPDTATSTRIGYFDAPHTSNTGLQNSETQQIGPNQWAAGFSDRYSGSQRSGQTAWAYNMSSGTIRQIGLSGPEFVGPLGGDFNRPISFSRTNLILGETQRFVGADPYWNAAAWVHDPASDVTRRVGLTDPEHTAVDGSQFSRVSRDFTGPDAGVLIGSSSRREGYGFAFSAWTYDPGTQVLRTVDGLTGSAFVSSTGVRSTHIADLSQSGFIAGRTRRFGPSDVLAGSTGWLYNPSTNQTAPIGPTGPDYTHPVTGLQDGWLTGLNEAGQVAGLAVYQRDGAQSYRGWFYDPASNQTREIGIHFNDALEDPGRIRNEPLRMNEAGYVVGRGHRFLAEDFAGQAGWVYDPAAAATTALVFSTRPDGYAWSEAFDVSLDGLVTGTYTRYSGMTSEGEFAFYWSEQGGFVDVGSLVQGGLAANGWERLVRAQLPDPDGTIRGFGIRLDGSRMPFALQVVPEPAVAGLLFTFTVLSRRFARVHRRERQNQ